jgi:hypothetical protein
MAEQKCLRLDGSEVDVEVIGLPFNFEGKSAVLSVVRDVTEKKQARGSFEEGGEAFANSRVVRGADSVCDG